jgi:hypothetical protein
MAITVKRDHEHGHGLKCGIDCGIVYSQGPDGVDATDVHGEDERVVRRKTETVAQSLVERLLPPIHRMSQQVLPQNTRVGVGVSPFAVVDVGVGVGVRVAGSKPLSACSTMYEVIKYMY